MSLQQCRGWTCLAVIILLILVGGCASPLHHAAAMGNTEEVRRLLDAGTPIDDLDITKITPLLYAIMGYGQRTPAHEETVLLLLNRGADPNARLGFHASALHLAIPWGSMRVIEALIDKGADIHAQNAQGLTPLHSAAGEGRLDVAKLLVARGADVRARANDSTTPLHMAAVGGHYETMAFLLDHGVEVDLASSTHSLTPLHGAIRGEWAGGSIFWRPPLIGSNLAVNRTNGHLACMELLLQRGANANAIAHDSRKAQWSTLQLAAETGRYYQFKRLLLAHGVSTDAVDGLDLTAGKMIVPATTSEHCTTEEAGVILIGHRKQKRLMAQYIVLRLENLPVGRAWLKARFDNGTDQSEAFVEGPLVIREGLDREMRYYSLETGPHAKHLRVFGLHRQDKDISKPSVTTNVAIHNGWAVISTRFEPELLGPRPRHAIHILISSMAQASTPLAEHYQEFSLPDGGWLHAFVSSGEYVDVGNAVSPAISRYNYTDLKSDD
ncbi:MAG: hypothetical protein GMKNLPBB_01411 [Myxococcota bacterium]|nr:hypothetical protein [Myxococcota bacterium]